MDLLSLTPGLALGALLGVRHAFEPDHLAAVSTMVARHRDARAGAFVGAFWGMGHSLALLSVGLVLGVLHTELPVGVGNAFELAVACMLVVLGARALRRAVQLGPAGPRTAHHHGRTLHAHAAHADHVHVAGWTLARQPLLVGLVHGLAGSGALTALVLANMPNMLARVLYMMLFGLGSILGMAALSGLAGFPLSRLGGHERAIRALSATTGAFSLVLGVCWGWPIAQTFLAH